MNDDISAGVVPKRTKAAITVVKGLDTTRFFGLIFIFFIGTLVGGIFGDGVVKYIFTAFCIVVFFILTSKSPTNPTNKFYMGLITFIKFMCRNKTYYGTHSQEYQEFEEAKERAKAKKEKRNSRNSEKHRKKEKD